MTQDEIIKMAKQAGFSSAVGKHIALDDDLKRFAKFIASAEREACAKHVESLMTGNEHLTIVMGAIGDSIRAREQA
jgi:hypothetical protein